MKKLKPKKNRRPPHSSIPLDSDAAHEVREFAKSSRVALQVVTTAVVRAGMETLKADSHPIALMADLTKPAGLMVIMPNGDETFEETDTPGVYTKVDDSKPA